MDLDRIGVGLSPLPNSSPGSYASILKLRSSLLSQAITALGVEVAGAMILAWNPRRINALGGYEEPAEALLSRHLTFRAWTVFAGASEIQRDIIAKLVIR
jgi:alkylation response protein AidB-like acyl-CoA dehydrogenase